MAAFKHKDLEILRRLLRQAKPYRFHLLGVLALHLVSAPLALLQPVPLKIAVDSVIDSRPLPGFLQVLVPADISSWGILVLAIGLVLLIALLRKFQGLGTWVPPTYLAERLTLDFRNQLFRHVQRLSLSYQ